MAQSKAKLTYWDGRGNAEIIRMMLVVCGEDWEEKVFESEAQHLTKRSEMENMISAGVLCFDQVPLLEIDGLRLCQRHAIVKYLARKHNLYGKYGAAHNSTTSN
eukprot:m.755008 g.755008  ORF g.755008 m.755008 type:complete len:104 (-) comp23179_c0_seq10:949-1260(-)